VSRLPRCPGRRYGKTRRQRIASLRRDLVHAAGEALINHNCCTTAPLRTEIHLEWFDESWGQEVLEFIRSGIVAVPRSLRALWHDLLKEWRLGLYWNPESRTWSPEPFVDESELATFSTQLSAIGKNKEQEKQPLADS
jgi:hypothetical protein